MAPGFSTPSVAIATTPTVISTFFTHLFASRKRKSAANKSLKEGGPGGGPEDQLSYEEGLKVVRRFLDFASNHGVEEVQAFTAMPVPTPHWVRKKTVKIPDGTIDRAAEILTEHLSTYGPDGVHGGGLKMVGGSKWWRIRGRELEGEWIEMQKDYLRRKARLPTDGSEATTTPAPPISGHHYLPRRSATLGSVKDNTGAEVLGERVILYIHGGAFFFSSLDTHRYQVQRHARKAGARAFSPAYRLAPQYPFPCGILDALASYLYLIDPPPGVHAPILPTSIIMMGDSAGAGMVISLLIIIREMGLPMPAGASLISPWVDLTHSMPSIGGYDGGDFIPSTGFHYKPSCAWPPLPGDGIRVTMPDGLERVFDEQVQMYCPNKLLTHPLVSPVNLGSLGGLCPLLILGGGGELLRDEIIYLAHKAAAPTTYLPSPITLAQYPDQTAFIDKYPPTKVHLQVYEGCCHVAPTLSWTRSSKYMYRACANFNIWALTAAGKAIEHKLLRKHSKSRLKHNGIASEPYTTTSFTDSPPGPSRSTTLDHEQASGSPNGVPSNPSSAMPSNNPSLLDLTQPIINSRAASAANAEEVEAADLESEASTSDDDSDMTGSTSDIPSTGVVTVRGSEPIPTTGHIVAERVSTHGNIRPFEDVGVIPALNPDLREHIGQVHGDGAIQKWLAKRAEWDSKYGSRLEKWRKIRREDREKAEKDGFLTRDLHGENPPLCSLASWWDAGQARAVGRSVDEFSGKSSGAMTLWMKMSTKADREHAGGDDLQEIEDKVNEEIKVERERRESVVSRTEAQIGSSEPQ